LNRTYAGDLYGAAALRNSLSRYKAIRDLGSVVWASRHKLWAVGRFEDVRQALRAADGLVSGQGVAANDQVNAIPMPITLTSDGEIHDRRRGVLIRPMTPGPLKDLRPRLEGQAEVLVDKLATGARFDAMASFASHLPVAVVAELVGLNEEGRAHMLRWAAATFEAMGAMNARGLAALPTLMELSRYVRGLDRSLVAKGGWAARLFDAADADELSAEEAAAMVIDYVGPSLDTTILATGHMVWRLANTPRAYDQLRAEPALIPSVVNEAVRLASPIRSFTRYAVEDVEIGDDVIPKGGRALILFASANRDERHYPDPDRFDIRRNPRDHLAWGHGPHVCVGMHLARLEMEVLLAALVRNVGAIETGRPSLAWNNVLQGFQRLPARFLKAPRQASRRSPVPSR
jgi:cytochrome P450